MSNQHFKLIKKIKMTGQIECLSGLRIGGSTSSLSIGGIDSIIIRNPKDNKPYIPGSSLKGKLRYLTEISEGKVSVFDKEAPIKYGPSDDVTSTAVKLFGASTDKKNTIKFPSRVIVRDAHIQNQESDFPYAPVPFAELKTEVVIDRITSKANPRTIERVPAGAIFNLEIILNIFNFTIQKVNGKEILQELNENGIIEEEKILVSQLLKSLQLLTEDYLGGNGSRGYGNITIKNLQLHQMLLPNTEYSEYTTNNTEIKNLIAQFSS